MGGSRWQSVNDRVQNVCSREELVENMRSGRLGTVMRETMATYSERTRGVQVSRLLPGLLFAGVIDIGEVGSGIGIRRTRFTG